MSGILRLGSPPEPPIMAHVEYYEGRTDGWEWLDGQTRWWEKFIVWLDGFDGLGQLVCERRWRWNGSSETLRREIVHLPSSEVIDIPTRRPGGSP